MEKRKDGDFPKDKASVDLGDMLMIKKKKETDQNSCNPKQSSQGQLSDTARFFKNLCMPCLFPEGFEVPEATNSKGNKCLLSNYYVLARHREDSGVETVPDLKEFITQNT